MKKALSLAALALTSVLMLTGCAPEPEPEAPEKTFEVVAYVDGEEFQTNQQIVFNPLTPNQTQSKVIMIENLSNQDVVITNVSLLTAGELFDSGDVAVEVVTDEGASFDGVVLEPNASVSGVIKLVTTDSLRPGLNGNAALAFDAEPTQATAETES
jgi:hypothetical protein